MGNSRAGTGGFSSRQDLVLVSLGGERLFLKLISEPGVFTLQYLINLGPLKVGVYLISYHYQFITFLVADNINSVIY